MREYIRKSENGSRPADREPRASKQASLNEIVLQAARRNMPAAGSGPVIQRIGQSEIEQYYYEKLGITTMDDFGGLCGGWSSVFLDDPETAIKKWSELEAEMKKKKVTIKNKDYFRKIMYYHYCMRAADDGEEAEEGPLTRQVLRNPPERRIEKTTARLLRSYLPEDREHPTFDCASKEQLLEEVMGEIELCADGGKVYLASPFHHMGIKKINENKYLLSETEFFGMGEVNYNKLNACLRIVRWDVDEKVPDPEDPEKTRDVTHYRAYVRIL